MSAQTAESMDTQIMNSSNATSISSSGSAAITDIIESSACGISTNVLYILRYYGLYWY